MAEQPDPVWRDVAVVVRHYRFIGAVVVLTLLAAVATALIADKTYVATAEANIRLKGLPAGGEQNPAVPTLETFVNLAKDDTVAEDAARRLGRDASDADALRSRVSVSSVPAGSGNTSRTEGKILIRATGASSAEARDLAGAWMEAFRDRARSVQADEQTLESLQQQVDAARRHLEALGPAGASGTETVRKLQAEASTLDAALAFLRGPGSALPADQLRFALGGFLGDESARMLPGSTPEILNALEARRQAVDQGIRHLLPAGVGSQDTEALASEAVAARGLYDTALRRVAEARLVTSLVKTEVQASSPTVAASGANWLIRVGGALAFGLVVGVVGAFGLEYARGWRRSLQVVRENISAQRQG